MPKRSKTLAFILLLVISVGVFGNLGFSCATDGVYSKEYTYSYGRYDWTLTLSVPRSVYDAYKAVPVSYRIQNGPAGYSYLTSTEDATIIALANELKRSATEKGYSQYDTVSLILAFVQSLRYTSDSSTAAYDEYPRFPVETLVDDGGDCEDTSILFATIMAILGYGVIYINPPEHLAVGILGEDSVQGYYWTYNGQRYYYCETTGDGFQIGDLPSNMSPDQEAYLYDINLESQYVPGQQPIIPTIIDNDSSSFLGIATIIGGLITVMVVAIVVTYERKNKLSSPSFRTPQFYTQPTPPPNPIKFCTLCGTQNSVNSAYCERCGKRIL